MHYEPQSERLMRVAEGADFLQVAESTLRTWIRKGRIRAVRFGRLLRLDKRDLEEFINRCRS